MSASDGIPLIALCACCGNRNVPGVAGTYCIPCERAIRNSPNVALTPEAKAFVARLAARQAVSQ